MFNYSLIVNMPTVIHLEVESDKLVPTSYFLLPTSYFLLHPSHFLLPAAYTILRNFLLPISYFLLPTLLGIWNKKWEVGSRTYEVGIRKLVITS
jgi:hypothetical protein